MGGIEVSDIFDTIKDGMDVTLGKVKGLFKGDAWTGVS